jgi:hypothetical protein
LGLADPTLTTAAETLLHPNTNLQDQSSVWILGSKPLIIAIGVRKERAQPFQSFDKYGNVVLKDTFHLVSENDRDQRVSEVRVRVEPSPQAGTTGQNDNFRSIPISPPQTIGLIMEEKPWEMP